MRRARRFAGDAFAWLGDAVGRNRLPKPRDRAALPLGILMFHAIGEDPERVALSQGMEVPARRALEEIQFARRQGLAPVAVDDLDHPARWPRHARGLLLVCFDDGHRNAREFVSHLVRKEAVPVLLAICPEVVEQESIHWWEEVRARIACTPRPIEGIAIAYGAESAEDRANAPPPTTSDALEDWMRTLHPTQRQSALERLRAATDDIVPARIEASPHVRANMGWDEVLSLTRLSGVRAAAHSLSHDLATVLSANELAADAAACRERIEAHTGRRCLDWVYPNGRHTPATEAVLAAAGYVRTYTTDDALTTTSARLLLPRWRAGMYGTSRRLRSHQWRTRVDSAQDA